MKNSWYVPIVLGVAFLLVVSVFALLLKNQLTPDQDAQWIAVSDVQLQPGESMQVACEEAPPCAPTDTPTPPAPTDTPTPPTPTATSPPIIVCDFIVTTDDELSEAASNAVPGDVVCLQGSFSFLYIRISGEENAPITYRNTPGELAQVARVLIIASEGYTAPIGHIVLQGLEVTGSSQDGIKGYNTHHLTIADCNVHHNVKNNVLLASGAHHIIIERSEFHHSLSSLSYHDIYGNGNYWIIRNNLFHDSLSYSLQMAAYGSWSHSYILPGFDHLEHWLIANNTWSHTVSRSAIYIWDGYGGNVTDITIVNNIFDRNAEGTGYPNGVRFSASYDNISDVKIHNNNYFGSAAFIVNPGDAEYEAWDNMEADPLLDTRLRPSVNSPVIDAGWPMPEVTDDFDGLPRPQGMAYDMGAFEQ